MGGVFAAILSTADSQLLVVASTFARDVYEKILRRDSKQDEAARLRLGRARDSDCLAGVNHLDDSGRKRRKKPTRFVRLVMP